MSTFFLAWLFARRPVGPTRWPRFIVLTLFGTLAFSIPFFLWLNWRQASEPRPDFATWWRSR